MSERASQGVNLHGYALAESGVGEQVRLLAKVLREAEEPFSVLPFRETPSRQQAEYSERGTGDWYDVSLAVVNADEFPRFSASLDRRARYTIGMWAWELDWLPPHLADSEVWLDEVWSCSRFSAGAIARAVTRPVHALPLPITPPKVAPLSRSELGLPENGFLFLFCFDFDSVFARKNPLGLLEAFRRAFSGAGPPWLVLKSVNAERHPEDWRRLQEAVNEVPAAIAIDRYEDWERQKALFAACDAYVSLHRSEGFGLTLGETMALGKPVIATGYSGNMDFMTPENSYPVSYRLVPVGPDAAPYPADARWAEPDLDEAARVMRGVVDHPEEAAARAERARLDVEQEHSPASRARFVRERLDRVRMSMARARPETEAERRAREREETTRAEFVRSLEDLEERIRHGPDPNAGSAWGPLARFARRMVLRGLRSYDHHNREILLEICRHLKMDR